MASNLNLGCGHAHVPGYPIGLDRYPYAATDLICDLRWLPIKSVVISSLWASHVIEHFDVEDAPALLREWCRVLLPNGVLQALVPDIAAYVAHRDELPDDVYRNVLHGQPDPPEERHRSRWDEDSLVTLLRVAGFQDAYVTAEHPAPTDWRFNVLGIK